jgi:uncharacterized SAM-binding protein YcdF (DUF218 family)
LNSLLVLLGVESWKPLLAVLLLPPVPLLLLVLLGARLLPSRRGLGWSLIVLSVALLWLSACSGTERLLMQHVLRPPPALAAEQVAALKARYAGHKDVAIVVLGGGAQPFAPEYGVSNLKPASVERLRYGLWLGRETGLPLAFSGGAGWAAGADATPEAQTAARIARQEFGRPLQWIEDRSRDTRQNAGLSVALLRTAGVRHVVLVTHAYHMPRALRAFRDAAGDAMTVEAAPMGLGATGPVGALRWLPTAAGLSGVHDALHEVAGLLAGA